MYKSTYYPPSTRPLTNEHTSKHATSMTATAQSLREQAIDMLLTHRGDAAAAVDRALIADPADVAAHCLRAAIIVCGDAYAARDKIAASIAAIEQACPDPRDPARRHAAAAHAWLVDDQALALARYGAIVLDRP